MLRLGQTVLDLCPIKDTTIIGLDQCRIFPTPLSQIFKNNGFITPFLHITKSIPSIW